MAERLRIIKRRDKRRKRVRLKVSGSTERPRLSVYRSLRYIYAQIIDDSAQKTLVSVSSISKGIKEGLSGKANIETAKQIGELIAKRALERKISRVVFDKNRFRYHGKVKALADAARAAGLQF